MNFKIKILLILGICLLFSGCFFTDQSDNVVAILEGFGSYDSATDTSTINFQFHVKSENILFGVIEDWQISFVCNCSACGSRTVARLAKNSYDWILCDDIHCSNAKIMENSLGFLIEVTVKGDYYLGENPDIIYLEVNIMDENDNLYSIESNASYEFTRN